MQTTVSTKGQVVLPQPARQRLGIRAGDRLEVTVHSDRIVLTPRRKRTRRARIVKDPLTGFSVIDAGPGAPILTHKQVREMLADFP
jgi:AbrB family looped-hinge helix DNA binding protein